MIYKWCWASQEHQKLPKVRGTSNEINSVLHFYRALDKVCIFHEVQIFIAGADLCAPNGRLAFHIRWMGLSSRCSSWCSNLSLVKATAFPPWMTQCLCSVLGTETVSSLFVFAGGDEGKSVLVTQKQKVAFKMLVQEKHRTKWHLSVKMKEACFCLAQWWNCSWTVHAFL